MMDDDDLCLSVQASFESFIDQVTNPSSEQDLPNKIKEIEAKVYQLDIGIDRLKIGTRQLDMEVHQLDMEVHQLDMEVHQLDMSVHRLDTRVHQLDVSVHQLATEVVLPRELTVPLVHQATELGEANWKTDFPTSDLPTRKRKIKAIVDSIEASTSTGKKAKPTNNHEEHW